MCFVSDKILFRIVGTLNKLFIIVVVIGNIIVVVVIIIIIV